MGTIRFITETVNLDILAFNDTPVLPTDINGALEAIVIPNATEILFISSQRLSFYRVLLILTLSMRLMV